MNVLFVIDVSLCRITKDDLYGRSGRLSYCFSNHRNMKTKLLLLVLVMISCMMGSSQTSSYYLVNQVDIKNALVSEHKNVLKIFDVAVDEVRGKAYASGFQTEYASVVDLETITETGSVELPFAGLKNELECNPSNGFLLATTPETSPVITYLINPLNSQVAGTYAYQNSCNGICFDEINNHIFLADNNRIKILNGNDMSVIDSFPAGYVMGDIGFDKTNHAIYAVSRNLVGPNMVIKAFSSAAPYPLLNTIYVPSANILGELLLDIANDRLFAFGVNDIKTIRISTKTIVSEVSTSMETTEKVYSSYLQTLFMTNEDGYSGQGEHGSWSKIYKHIPGTSALDSVKMGDKTARLAMDNTRHILIVPDMHSGYLEFLNLQTNEIDSVDIGESADDFALSPDGQRLYIAKRLGGSRVITYDKNTHGLTQKKAGVWPCVVVVDSLLGRLFVLNEFESSVSVFNCNTNEKTGTIMLSIPEGRKDAIPTMYLDQPSHRIFISFPEFGCMIKVNAQTLTEEDVISIPGFHFNEEEHYGIGIIQLITFPPLNKLLVLQKTEKKLKIFDENSLALIDSADLSSAWPNGSVFESNLMAYDAASGNLFFGNKILNPVNYHVVASLPAAEHFLGYLDGENKIFGISSIGGEVKVNEYDAANFALTSSRVLFQQSGIAMPVFYYDSDTHDLFISEFNYALLRHYDLDSTVVTSVSDGTNAMGYCLWQNFPNPFSHSTTISFNTPRSGMVNLVVYDVNGNPFRTLVSEYLPAGCHDREFIAQPGCSGIYFMVLQTPETRIVKKMIVQESPSH